MVRLEKVNAKKLYSEFGFSENGEMDDEVPLVLFGAVMAAQVMVINDGNRHLQLPVYELTSPLYGLQPHFSIGSYCPKGQKTKEMRQRPAAGGKNDISG